MMKKIKNLLLMMSLKMPSKLAENNIEKALTESIKEEKMLFLNKKENV